MQSDLFETTPECGPQELSCAELVPRLNELKAQGHWVHLLKVMPNNSGYEISWLPGMDQRLSDPSGLVQKI